MVGQPKRWDLNTLPYLQTIKQKILIRSILISDCEENKKQNKKVFYLEQRSCKNWPTEFDLCGLRYSRVSPSKGHPRLPGGALSSSVTCPPMGVLRKVEIKAISPNKSTKPTGTSSSAVHQEHTVLVIFKILIL